MRNALAAAVVLLAGCATPPFTLSPKTPDLGIAPVDKRPATIAVVVAEPMPYTAFYQGQGTYTRDMTADVRKGGFPLESSLSKIAVDTFSQAFTQVVPLRDLPAPGQYDAVVTLGIGQILMKEHVVVTGETCDTTAEWSFSVLDRQNKELLSRKGVSPSHNFTWNAFNPGPGFVSGMDQTMSAILNELAKGWADDLRGLRLGRPGGSAAR